MKRIVAACTALASLSAWGSPTLTENTCIVTHASGFVGTTGNQEHIEVAQNGRPCVMEMSAGRERMELGGQAVTPPAHGSVATKVSAYATLIEYTPNRDYIGSDRFQLSFGPDFNDGAGPCCVVATWLGCSTLNNMPADLDEGIDEASTGFSCRSCCR